MNVPAEKIRGQILALLDAWGMEKDLAQVTAEVMVETDLAGVDSHGVSMLMDYESLKAKGKLNLKARPKVVKDGPVTALIDAGDGLGHPAAVMAMNLAVTKASSFGAGIVTVRNSNHFGAAGYYADLAAKAGMVGMVTSATRTIAVVPTRGKAPMLGTNPIALSAPAKRNAPFHLDMATASAANNKIKVYGFHKKPLPAGWVLDDAGKPVTDADEAMKIVYETKKGGQTPLGGTPEMASHKGYGLALLVHILGGTLPGATFSPIRVKTQKPSDPDRTGHFCMAIDPKAFRPDGEFEADLDAVIDELHAAPAIDPARPVLVPGDPEIESRMRRLREGIPMPETLMAKLKDVCARSSVPFLLQ
jgi:LDH2 family malate/lactate/ureidoglycolate dehydrogenase